MIWCATRLLASFNPSSGITSVLTLTRVERLERSESRFQSLKRDNERSDGGGGAAAQSTINLFQSLKRDNERSDGILFPFSGQFDKFQSLKRDNERSDDYELRGVIMAIKFQSLKRDNERSDSRNSNDTLRSCQDVSIPQAG